MITEMLDGEIDFLHELLQKADHGLEVELVRERHKHSFEESRLRFESTLINKTSK